jgi:hypothetical protein
MFAKALKKQLIYEASGMISALLGAFLLVGVLMPVIKPGMYKVRTGREGMPLHMSARIVSFGPVSDGRARVIILGSMPGAASLRVGQYYAHPRIRTVLFNGATAERCYKKHVLPEVQHRSLTYIRLPSTSPAHAALSLEHKVEAWRVVTGV